MNATGRVSALVAGGLLGVGLLLMSEDAAPAPTRLITMTGSGPIWSIDQLSDAASLVAVVRPTGQTVVHWNSLDGREWQMGDDSVRSPMIYRDDTFAVREVIRGDPPGDTIVVRGVGGRVGDVVFEHENQTEWEASKSYLAFLVRAQTPTREGWEEAWALVEIGQGALMEVDGRWRNPTGMEVQDIAELPG